MNDQLTVPGYVEATVIVDAADDGSIDFDFTQGKEMEDWLDRTKHEAMRHPERRTEIYLMQHDHDRMDEDCACAQYLTDHHPFWSFGGKLTTEERVNGLGTDSRDEPYLRDA